MATRDPSQDTATRSEILNQALKMLLALNAGGALALLTWVQAVWGQWPDKSLEGVLNGVVWLLVGALLVPAIAVVRYINGLLPISFQPFRNPVWYLINLMFVAAGICFFMGVLDAVQAGYWAIEQKT